MKAISSMATRYVLVDLLEAASAAGLGEVEMESVGGVDAERRVAAGERFDLVFLADGALRRLADAGHVNAVSITPLVLSQVAVAVASDSAAPAASPESSAFADASGVRAALRAAHGIGYSTGPSGTALVRMIDDWGLSSEIGDRLVQARPGVPVATLIADGEVDLGFQQLSELVGKVGVRVLGVMPGDCPIDTVFAGAVATASGSRDRAARVLEFLTSGETAAIREAHGFSNPRSFGSQLGRQGDLNSRSQRQT